jgi:hypothetical protein
VVGRQEGESSDGTGHMRQVPPERISLDENKERLLRVAGLEVCSIELLDIPLMRHICP